MEFGIVSEERMTAHREWPNTARDVRDETAERVQKAYQLIKPVMDSDTRIMRAALEMVQALRLLESAGAPTRPEKI